MKVLGSLALVLGVALTFGCKDAGTEICLEDFEKFEKSAAAKDGKTLELASNAYQMCGISCDVTEREDSCAAFKKLTEAICDEGGKESCQTLCDGGNQKNEHACAKVEQM